MFVSVTVPMLLVASLAGSPATTAPTVTVSPPPVPLRLRVARSCDITIQNRSQTPLDNLRVVRSTLSSGDAALDTRFLCLSAMPVAACSQARPVTVAPGAPVTVSLTVDPAFALNGEFKGSIWLADAAGDAFDFAATIDATTNEAAALGLLCIAVGAFLSWFITRYLRGRSQRIDAELPAIELGETVGHLQSALSQACATTGATCPSLSTKLGDLKGQLSEKTLDERHYLPPRFPTLWSAPRSAAYAAFLTAASTAVSTLTVLVKNGVEPAAARWDTANAVVQNAVRAALIDLDARSAWTSSVAAAQTAVTQVLQQLQKAIQSTGKAIVGPWPKPTDAEPTLATLRVELERIAGAAWLAWGALTLVAGYAALIFPNAGFGASGDFFKCFLWGLGIQTVGRSLQNLSPSTATTLVSVNVPKVIS